MTRYYLTYIFSYEHYDEVFDTKEELLAFANETFSNHFDKFDHIQVIEGKIVELLPEEVTTKYRLG